MLGAYLLPVGLIVSAMGFMAYRAARLSLEGQLGESLMAMARTAAGQVGKPRALRLAPGDEQSRTYARLRQKLADLKQMVNAEQSDLYAARPQEARDLRALLDAYPDEARRWHASLAGTSSATGAATPPLLEPDREEKLRALGYLD